MVKYPEKFAKKEIICPYCNYEFGDSWEYGSGSGEYTEDSENCYECGKKFTWTRDITVDYSSQADCKLNEEEHDWIKKRIREDLNYLICSKCGELKIEDLKKDK